MKAMLDLVEQHHRGLAVGIYSVCSAHPLVIKSALSYSKTRNQLALIEATSNQVNQDGGYTGMVPDDFKNLVLQIAEDVGMPRERILLGGDHLGPNCWQHLPAEEAMEKSDKLINDYVEAGFRKIHLDCSMSCQGDPVPLTDAIVAARAARLCAVAEMAWQRVGGEPPVYIIGTEVPVPGGATESLDALAVTTSEAATETLEAHYQAFKSAEIEVVWSRVVGLVVQPGVEFDHHKVVDYRREKAAQLSKLLESEAQLVFEAHSTDYQTPGNLKALVEDHFAILKVGPGVTFALREAIWALDTIEQEWLNRSECSGIKEVMLAEMRSHQGYWKSYYHSAGQDLTLDLQYSLSDRIRYYWPSKTVQNAFNKLKANFSQQTPPLTLVSQYLPDEYIAIREGKIPFNVEAIVEHKIHAVLKQYADACEVAEEK